ncbi:hypothetical protein BJG92_02134 [Arthrobacter sp. SO5]|nr:hypothetical protein [Arthrobacter sp. SO5]MCB5274597.1 hypothetical protein [Arthrobacter sp. SO5]
MGGAGGLGGGGFRRAIGAADKGAYTVTAVCVGAPHVAVERLSEQGP